MNYKATLEAFGDCKKIMAAFEAEEKRNEDRSSLNIREEKEKIIFDIQAKDSVALRATLNNITKLLTVFEKMENIKNE